MQYNAQARACYNIKRAQVKTNYRPKLGNLEQILNLDKNRKVHKQTVCLREILSVFVMDKQRGSELERSDPEK